MANVFTAYIDDSGTDPKQQVAIATGLVIPSKRIIPLQIEWDALRLREVFSSFHMSEFSSPTPPPNSEFLGWGKEKHERVYRRVREISKEYGVTTISFAVLKKDYDEVVPRDIRRNAGNFHYTWAVRHLVAGLEKWRHFFRISEPFEYVFDWMKRGDERRAEIEEVMAQGEELAIQNGTPGIYTNYSFRRRQELPGLQCVDVLGWVSYQFALLAFCKKPLVPDAQIGWDDFENHLKYSPDGPWRLAATLKRTELERWIKLEKEKGLSRPFFDAWEAKKSIKKQITKDKNRGV